RLRFRPAGRPRSRRPGRRRRDRTRSSWPPISRTRSTSRTRRTTPRRRPSRSSNGRLPRVVSRGVGDRLEETALWNAEEQTACELVVALFALDCSLSEPALDLGALLGRDAHADVIARAAALMKGEAVVADVRHHGVSFGL